MAFTDWPRAGGCVLFLSKKLAIHNQFAVRVQSRNPLLSPLYVIFLIDLTWTRVWQNEDPKFARWQLFRWILSREQWLSSQKQTFTTTCSMPLMGEALLLLFPPYCTTFLFAMGAPLSSTSFLAIYSFPKYFPQMTVPLKKETKPKPQSNKPKHRTHTNCEEKAGVFNHGLLQAWRSPMAGQT